MMGWFWLRVFYEAAVYTSTELQSASLFGGGSASKLAHILVRKTRFFPRCWTDHLSYSLTSG